MGSYQPRRHRRSERRTASGSTAGFSLVETMVALVILAVGILSVGQLLTQSRGHSNYSRHETAAINLAQEVKERIYSENFDDIKSIFNGADTDNAATINTSTDEWAAHVDDALGTNGRGTVRVEDSADDPTLSAGMYRVTINISWVEGPKARSIPHTFLLSKIGL